MSLETSKKVLKISGIITIVFAVIGIVFGLLMFAGGGAAASGAEGAETLAVGAVFGIGIVAILSSLIGLAEGIFAVRGANDSAKIMPAWVLAILGVVSRGINLITGLVNKTSILSPLAALLISIVVFIAANTIKENR